MFKKLLPFVSLFLLFVSVFPSLSYAVDRQPKDVKGKVRFSNGQKADSASVVASCGSSTQNTTADSNGKFSVTFSENQCFTGNTITVVASKNGNSGSQTTVATDRRNHNIGDVVLNAAAVPEFGTVTGAVAFMGSLSAFYLFRRKQQYAKVQA